MHDNIPKSCKSRVRATISVLSLEKITISPIVQREHSGVYTLMESRDRTPGKCIGGEGGELSHLVIQTSMVGRSRPKGRTNDVEYSEPVTQKRRREIGSMAGRKHWSKV